MKFSCGFSLIELVLTFSVVIILGAFAIPSYFNYMHREYFSEIITATALYKEGVEKCYQIHHTFQGCDGGRYHIPPNLSTPKDNIALLTVVSGVITITPVPRYGMHANNHYVLTPSIKNKAVVWSTSGSDVK